MSKNRQLEFEDERSNTEETIKNLHLNRTPIALLLDGLGGYQNIGLLFRMADATRLKHIYLYNCPVELSSSKVKKVARAALNYVPYTILENAEDLQKIIAVHHLVALEISKNSVPYTSFIPPPNKEILMAIGAEINGISKDILEQSADTIHLPMLGVNTSLNVACATSVAVYHLLSKL